MPILAILCALSIGCAPAPVNEDVPPVAKQIFHDAGLDAMLWMRWTAAYWLLATLAAGTAVAAAIKNARTTSNTSPTTTDKSLVLIAGLAALATAATGFISPAQQADRYRMADLLLQDAIMDYRESPRSQADLHNLVNNWHQAQNILEGKVQVTQTTSTPPPKQSQTEPSAPSTSPTKP